VGFFVSVGRALRGSKEAFPVMCGGAAGYAIGVIWLEPFLFLQEDYQIAAALVALMPLITAGVHLPRRGEWLTVVGLPLFVFVGVAMLSSNVGVRDGGSGFQRWWRGR